MHDTRMNAFRLLAWITPPLLLLCAFGVLAGLWLAVMEGILRHPGYEARTIQAAAIAAVSLVIGIAVLAGTRPLRLRIGIAAAGCWLGIVGVSALVRVAGSAHFEGFAAVIGAALVAESLLTLASVLVQGKPA